MSKTCLGLKHQRSEWSRWKATRLLERQPYNVHWNTCIATNKLFRQSFSLFVTTCLQNVRFVQQDDMFTKYYKQMFHKCFRNMFGTVGRPPKKFSNKKGILVQYLAHWVISPKNILEEIVWVVFAKATTNILFGEMNTSQQTMIESIFWEIYMIYMNISHKYFWTSLWANIFLKQLFKRYHSPKK